MKLVSRDWNVSSIDHLDNCSVVLTKTFSDVVKQVFMFQRGAKKSKLICFFNDTSYVFIDGLVSFAVILQLLF